MLIFIFHRFLIDMSVLRHYWLVLLRTISDLWQRISCHGFICWKSACGHQVHIYGLSGAPVGFLSKWSWNIIVIQTRKQVTYLITFNPSIISMYIVTPTFPRLLEIVWKRADCNLFSMKYVYYSKGFFRYLNPGPQPQWLYENTGTTSTRILKICIHVIDVVMETGYLLWL